MFTKKILASALIAAGALAASALPLPSLAAGFDFFNPAPARHDYTDRRFDDRGRFDNRRAYPGQYRPTRSDRDGDGIPDRLQRNDWGRPDGQAARMDNLDSGNRKTHESHGD